MYKKHVIFVFIDVKEFYFFNFEKERSIIIIERINVVNNYFTFSVLIIQN